MKSVIVHRFVSLAFLALLGVGAARAAEPAPKDIANSVVKVFSTMRYPDPYKPWTKQSPVDVTGSGVIIDGKRILTNAHVVLYASQVQVQANEAGDKMAATVVAIAPDIDLAVLKLEDESFFDSRPPIVRASKLPEIKDTVLAYGYPTGGSSLSITKGIVSRIEFVPYKFPVSGLRIQIDAAINPGNSGGPAIAGDKMIGLAFRKLTGDDNIGYIIPNEEVELFLKDVADGKYDGKPAMYDDLQTLENPAMREFLKLDKSVEGVVVHAPYKDDASYPLKQWDVITKIGDAPIDNQGMVKLGPDMQTFDGRRSGFGYSSKPDVDYAMDFGSEAWDEAGITLHELCHASDATVWRGHVAAYIHHLFPATPAEPKGQPALNPWQVVLIWFPTAATHPGFDKRVYR